MTDEDARAILETAWSAGIRYFDTAPHYGLGLSERRLGAFLQTKPRDEFTISTKAGRLLEPNGAFAGGFDDAASFVVPDDQVRRWDFTRDGIRRSVDESIERLGLDRVDIVYLHDPDEYDLDQADASAYPALERLKAEGVIDRVGVGSMSVEALERAALRPGLDILMIAGRLTLAEQPALDVLGTASTNGMDVVAAGVFNSGLLAASHPTADARYEYAAAPGAMLAHVTAIERVCERFGISLPTAALHYPLRFPQVSTIVIAAGQPAHLVQNLERLGERVPEELWMRLEADGLVASPGCEP
jgi:D-threo-aldose 1-dehydrogenase